MPSSTASRNTAIALLAVLGWAEDAGSSKLHGRVATTGMPAIDLSAITQRMITSWLGATVGLRAAGG